MAALQQKQRLDRGLLAIDHIEMPSVIFFEKCHTLFLFDAMSFIDMVSIWNAIGQVQLSFFSSGTTDCFCHVPCVSELLNWTIPTAFDGLRRRMTQRHSSTNDTMSFVVDRHDIIHRCGFYSQ